MLEEQTGYRILHALRFPLVATFIVLLSVASVVVSLTGPSGPQSLEPARSQESLSSIMKLTSVDVQTDSGYLNSDRQEAQAEQTEAELPVSKTAPKAEVALPMQSESGISKEATAASSSFVPNYVGKGDEMKLTASFSPLQISWNYKNFQENPNNFYIVQAPRRKIIKLYDGNKGRELLENGFDYPCTLEFKPSQYSLLLDFLTVKK